MFESATYYIVIYPISTYNHFFIYLYPEHSVIKNQKALNLLNTILRNRSSTKHEKSDHTGYHTHVITFSCRILPLNNKPNFGMFLDLMPKLQILYNRQRTSFSLFISISGFIQLSAPLSLSFLLPCRNPTLHISLEQLRQDWLPSLFAVLLLFYYFCEEINCVFLPHSRNASGIHVDPAHHPTRYFNCMRSPIVFATQSSVSTKTRRIWVNGKNISVYEHIIRTKLTCRLSVNDIRTQAMLFYHFTTRGRDLHNNNNSYQPDKKIKNK